MKKYLILFIILSMVFSLFGPAVAQFPFWIGIPNPFSYPISYLRPIEMLPPLLPMGPFVPPVLSPRNSLSLLAPPRPIIRQAAATAIVTILFNPTQSIIQVTVLPVGATVTSVPAVTPTAVAPTIGPTALFLLPLLTGLGGTTPQTQIQTIGAAVAPTTPVTTAPTGLTSLLPLI